MFSLQKFFIGHYLLVVHHPENLVFDKQAHLFRELASYGDEKKIIYTGVEDYRGVRNGNYTKRTETTGYWTEENIDQSTDECSKG